MHTKRFKKNISKDEVLAVMATQREAEERWQYDSGIYDVSQLELEKEPWHMEYHPSWRKVRRSLLERAGYRCECEGECGLPWEHGQRPDGRVGRRRCPNRQGQRAIGRRRKAVLCIAHTCQNKSCIRDSHLKVMCRACHWSYDQRGTDRRPCPPTSPLTL